MLIMFCRVSIMGFDTRKKAHLKQDVQINQN